VCAVYKEEALTEEALLKHLDGKADGKEVAKAEKKVVVSEEAGETEDTHPKPEPDAAGKSFFFKGIPGMGTLLFKVTAKVLSPTPHRHTHPHVGGSPSLTGDGALRCVCVPSQMEGKIDPDALGKAYGPNMYKCQRYDIGKKGKDGKKDEIQVLATCQHANHRVP